MHDSDLDQLVDELEQLLAQAERDAGAAPTVEEQAISEEAISVVLGLSAPAPAERQSAPRKAERISTGPQPRTGTGTQLGVGSVSGDSEMED
ncbi:MAG: hypothetical protein KC503_47665 [Myxococcales bacterium]|nr:hypothetical protein [Myxococcales bacterium]